MAYTDEQIIVAATAVRPQLEALLGPPANDVGADLDADRRLLVSNLHDTFVGHYRRRAPARQREGLDDPWVEARAFHGHTER